MATACPSKIGHNSVVRKSVSGTRAFLGVIQYSKDVNFWEHLKRSTAGVNWSNHFGLLQYDVVHHFIEFIWL